MSNLRTIVEGEGCQFKGQFGEQDAWRDAPPRESVIKKEIERRVRAIFCFLDSAGDGRRFKDVEGKLVRLVLCLGRLFLAYFLARRERESARRLRRDCRRGFRRGRPQSRLLGTFFGKVRYWRTYARHSGGTDGTYPLDIELGLTADGFSMLMLSLVARLSTLVSFDQVGGLLLTFLSWSPAKRTIENSVLGLGRHTADWFRDAPPPEDDGDVLVIQIDSKATPTATESELEKRRGKRHRTTRAASPRHRGRVDRERRGRKPRRKKGDKSKNGKATTVIVMYTMARAKNEEGKALLLGPINRWVYASYGPKRHAFAIARREADKRGFGRGSGKLTQLVTDGDEDLERYGKEFFPQAVHTLDIMHALEHVHKAGSCLHREGSSALKEWFEKAKALVYRGRIRKLVADLRRHLRALPRTGPGNKGKRTRLHKAIRYLAKRFHMMRYRSFIERDLEIGSGAVEGTVKHLVAKRFDNGSMRWIKERAEALLQLRAIEINGDWDQFTEFIHERIRADSTAEMSLQRVLTDKPAPLPEFGVAA